MPIDFKKVNNILRAAKSFIEMSEKGDGLTEEDIDTAIKWLSPLDSKKWIFFPKNLRP